MASIDHRSSLRKGKHQKKSAIITRNFDELLNTTHIYESSTYIIRTPKTQCHNQVLNLAPPGKIKTKYFPTQRGLLL